MTLVKLNLKTIQSSDLSQVLDLDRACLGGIWTLEGYQKEIESPNSFLIALKIESQVIGLGCAWAILEECHITLLAIHPDYQRQGLGQLITWHLLSNAVTRKLERATLEVKESNHNAIALYEKFGFKPAGIRKRYYPNGENAVIMWRSGLDSTQFPQYLNTWHQTIINQLQQHNYAIGL